MGGGYPRGRRGPVGSRRRGTSQRGVRGGALVRLRGRGLAMGFGNRISPPPPPHARPTEEGDESSRRSSPSTSYGGADSSSVRSSTASRSGGPLRSPCRRPSTGPVRRAPRPRATTVCRPARLCWNSSGATPSQRRTGRGPRSRRARPRRGGRRGRHPGAPGGSWPLPQHGHRIVWRGRSRLRRRAAGPATGRCRRRYSRSGSAACGEGRAAASPRSRRRAAAAALRPYPDQQRGVADAPRARGWRDGRGPVALKKYCL
jgi:hypothetical protein